MKPDQLPSWIELYQEFNQGPRLLEEELEPDLVVFRVVEKEGHL
jgi:hypothetical protein